MHHIVFVLLLLPPSSDSIKQSLACAFISVMAVSFSAAYSVLPVGQIVGSEYKCGHQKSRLCVLLK